jgi:hypothetical protein
MTVEEPTYVAAETSTLEVRWILEGTRPDAMVQWFGRLPMRMEWREDSALSGKRSPDS